MHIMALVILIERARVLLFRTKINLWASLQFFMNVNPMELAHESGPHFMENERNKQKTKTFLLRIRRG